MGIDHLTSVLNKDTERGFAAHAHVYRLLSQINHWPHEALESNPLKLLTLYILRLASTLPGLEFHPSTTTMLSQLVSERHRERSITLVKKSVPHYRDK